MTSCECAAVLHCIFKLLKRWLFFKHLTVLIKTAQFKCVPITAWSTKFSFNRIIKFISQSQNTGLAPVPVGHDFVLIPVQLLVSGFGELRHGAGFREHTVLMMNFDYNLAGYILLTEQTTLFFTADVSVLSIYHEFHFFIAK